MNALGSYVRRLLDFSPPKRREAVDRQCLFETHRRKRKMTLPAPKKIINRCRFKPTAHTVTRWIAWTPPRPDHDTTSPLHRLRFQDVRYEERNTLAPHEPHDTTRERRVNFSAGSISHPLPPRPSRTFSSPTPCLSTVRPCHISF